MAKAKAELISLKEAADMSGYTADYLGQLIRAGKLDGKQVFLNVAWMTTREAVAEYLKKNKKKQESDTYSWPQFRDWLFSLDGLQAIYAIVAWSVIVIFGLFVLSIAYVFAVTLDHRIEQKQMQKWQPKSSYEI